MIRRYGEELDKMDAEMQRGQSVMPNATPAQRFVTNVVLKALKNIRGITVHHATKADVERMLARLNEGKAKAEPLSTSDGTVYGWSVGNEIWLTDEGMNPETPIHEYIHLFVKAMAQEDSKEWRHVVELCKKKMGTSSMPKKEIGTRWTRRKSWKTRMAYSTCSSTLTDG